MRRSSSSSEARAGAAYIAPTNVKVPSGFPRYRSEVGLAGLNRNISSSAQRQLVKWYTGCRRRGRNWRNPSAVATRTSRYLASATRIWATRSAARAESAALGGRGGDSTMWASGAMGPLMAVWTASTARRSLESIAPISIGVWANCRAGRPPPPPPPRATGQEGKGQAASLAPGGGFGGGGCEVPPLTAAA